MSIAAAQGGGADGAVEMVRKYKAWEGENVTSIT